jgi:succinate dehydrogenase / fumarate reductase, cytochrome b subunit
MIATKRYFCSSVGKKTLVGLTGLAISLFALIHMAENILLLVGPDVYNAYAHMLVTNPLIYLAEAILAGLFLTHLILASSLFFQNRKARPDRYAVAARSKRASFAARTMILSGSVLLVFLVLHLWTFKFGAYYSTTVNGVEMRDLYQLVAEKFHEPLYVGWYLFALVVLGVHLSHGFAATFQSLGLRSSLHPTVRKLGLGFAGVVACGYLSIPLYFFFLGGR